MTHRIKDWKKFQHYKKRRPPWIRLYRELLDDVDFDELDPCDVRPLIKLWLMASEDESLEGILPDVRKVAHRLRISTLELLNLYGRLAHWVQDDSKLLASCPQGATPESETDQIREETKTKESAPPLRDGAPVEKGGNRDPGLKSEPTPSQLPVPKTKGGTKKPRTTKKSKEPKGDPVWREYIPAYRQRYGKEPIRNQGQNVAACQIIDKIGKKDAGAVAAFYVHSSNAWYIQKGHTLRAMVADAEKLHTEWATNRRTTQAGAREGDRLQEQGDVWQRVKARRLEESNG
jgi:hypothetical protein